MNQNKEINKSLKLLAKSSLFVFFIVIFSRFLGYIYRIIIARYFGPEVYGLFSLTLVILTWFIAVCYLGLTEGILRFTSLYRGRNKPDEIRYVFKFSLGILFLTSTLGGVILFLSSQSISIGLFHNPGLAIFLKITAFTLPFYIFAYTFLGVIQAFEKINVYSLIADFSLVFIKLSSLILLILIGVQTNAVIFSFFLGIFGIFLISYIYCKYKIPNIFKRYKLKKETKKDIRKKLLGYSLPLIFVGFFYSIFVYTDSFIIGFFKDAVQVGIYNAAVPIAELIGFFPGLFLRLFFPLINKEFAKKNFLVIGEISKQIQKWIFILSLPFFLLIIIFPGAFINLLFGSEYIATVNVLRLLAIGFFSFSMAAVTESLILMTGKSKLILINLSFLVAFNLILNIILVPKYGIIGAAFSTMISYIIISLLFFFQVKKYLSINVLRRKMLRVIIAVIPPTFVLMYIKQFIPINLATILLQVLFFILFYLFLIFITKSLDENDLMIIRTIKDKLTS